MMRLGLIRLNATQAVEFINECYPFAFTKVSAEDKNILLEGAEFHLYQLSCTDDSHDHSKDIVDPDNLGDLNSCHWIDLGAVESDADGKVLFEKIKLNAKFRLVETKAPPGYALPAGQWQITTVVNNVPAENGEEKPDVDIGIEEVSNGNQLPLAFVKQDDGSLLLPNVQPIHLPSSGSHGAVLFLAAGVLMMFSSVVIITVKKLRNQHAASK